MRLLSSATCSHVCSEPETVDRVLIYSVEQINDKNQLPFSVPIKQVRYPCSASAYINTRIAYYGHVNRRRLNHGIGYGLMQCMRVKEV